MLGFAMPDVEVNINNNAVYSLQKSRPLTGPLNLAGVWLGKVGKVGKLSGTAVAAMEGYEARCSPHQDPDR